MDAFFLKSHRLSFLQLDRGSVTHTDFTSASGYNGAASNEVSQWIKLPWCKRGVKTYASLEKHTAFPPIAMVEELQRLCH